MSKTPKFHIHYNRELEKKYYSERDYRADLKAKGLEPFNPAMIKSYEPKPYQGVSEEAKRMMNSVSYDRNGKPNIGDRYIDKLKEMGMKKVPKEIANKREGGYYAS